MPSLDFVLTSSRNGHSLFRSELVYKWSARAGAETRIERIRCQAYPAMRRWIARVEELPGWVPWTPLAG